MLVGMVTYNDLSCKKIYQELDYCETNFWTVTGGRITLTGWWLRAFYQNSHFLEAQPSAKNYPWILKFPFPWVAAVAMGCSFEFPPTGLKANFSLVTAHIIGLTISMDERTEACTTSIITSIKERGMIRIIRCVNDATKLRDFLTIIASLKESHMILAQPRDALVDDSRSSCFKPSIIYQWPARSTLFP